MAAQRSGRGSPRRWRVRNRRATSWRSDRKSTRLNSSHAKISTLSLHDARPIWTGSAWPLSVGQVYTTLTRLERGGLVEGTGGDGEGLVFYRLTTDGSAEVRAWFTTPVARSQPPRDELAI